ncbi:GFA family protein [Bartonella sp. LJL80]
MIASDKSYPSREGGCICGEVRFRAEPKSLDVGVCHCGMCRRWSGGVFMAIEVQPDWQEIGKSESSVYTSSDWGQRRFCHHCGTTIGWQLQDGSHLSLAVPAFDNDDGFVFTSEIYIDKKPAYYEFANQTSKLTEAEVLAALAEKGI